MWKARSHVSAEWLINGNLLEKAEEPGIRHVWTHAYVGITKSGIAMPIIYAVYLAHADDGTPVEKGD